MQMTHAYPARLCLAALITIGVAKPAVAQSATILSPGGGMVWGSLGFQLDRGGSVNSSGIGQILGQRAEINTNTWGERYDSPLLIRFGGAYNLDDRSQIFGAIGWEQAEADPADAGLIGGRRLEVGFTDYQSWDIDAGYRYFIDIGQSAMPFLSVSIGFQRLEAIAISLSAPPFQVNQLPFYAESWVAQWRVGTGVIAEVSEHFGMHATLDLKYSGVLSDEVGIGTLGFERINNVGNRWSLPIMGGVFLKF
jgi:hypothetical protein